MKPIVLLTSLSAACALVGCGGGVPVQVRLDELVLDFVLDDAVAGIEEGLRGAGLIAPEAAGLPELWPEELPPVCWATLVSSDEVEPLPVDLTPDPAEDPDAAKLFAPVNDGLVSRIELDRVVLRVEQNTSNVGLPPLELQAADAREPDPTDRRAWTTLGRLDGRPLAPGCGASGDATPVVGPGEVKDVELVWQEGGESFLGQQLMDPDCLERQQAAGEPANPLACKELSLRARSRLRFDTAVSPARPHGQMTLRMIVVATFYVDPT